MWVGNPAIALLLLATPLLAGAAETVAGGAVADSVPYPAPPPITNAASFVGLSPQEANRESPVRLEGVVTRVDATHNIVVLQDASGALPLDLGTNGIAVKAGTRIRIEADASMQRAPAYADYPGRAWATDVLPFFETRTNSGNYFLTRARALLRAPATGDYTFWIASKGASELWLSASADPGQAKKIAEVATGNNTLPRQWSKLPSQSSAPVHLSAGGLYYIEAVREQHSGRDDNLAVAWQGPGIKQAVIPGGFLVPWGGASGATNGVLHEVWTNVFTLSVEPFTTRGPLKPVVTLKAPRITELGLAEFPAPLRVNLDEALAPRDDFAWVETDGLVKFVGRSADGIRFELADRGARIQVQVRGASKQPLPHLDNSRVRVRGVFENALDASGELIPGMLWVPAMSEVTEVPLAPRDVAGMKLTPIGSLDPGNPELAWGRRVRIRGTVAQKEPGAIYIQGAGSFYAHLSKDGLEWKQAGPPIEIPMNDTVNVGLLATSMSRDWLTKAAFDHVIGFDGIGREADVYGSSPPGSVMVDESGYMLQGGGAGIGSSFDQFHFAYQPLKGSGEIIARIRELEMVPTRSGSAPPYSRANAGIMIRESLETKAPFAAITLSINGDALLSVRQKENERGDVVQIPGFAPPCWLRLERRYHGALARLDHDPGLRVGDAVEVTGLLAWENDRPVLRDARRISPAKEESVNARRTVAAGAVNSDDAVPRVNIADLLPEAGGGLKDGSGDARIRGVVTFRDRVAGTDYLAVQDATAGTFLKLSARFALQPLQVGQLVDFDVKSVNGKWPVPLVVGGINALGWGRLPEPVMHPAEYSLSGRGEGHWVEMDGIIRAVAPDGTLLVRGKEGTLPVWVAQLPKKSPADYVDALVHVRGVLTWTDGNSPLLLTPSPGFVEVTEPPLVNAFALPALTVARLKALAPEISLPHRFKVGGVVTYRDGSLLLVQDESGGVRVRTEGNADVNIGDAVEVVGFPEGGASLTLTEALVQSRGTEGDPVPVQPALEELLEGRLDATLVWVHAVLLNQQTLGARRIMELQSGQRVFQAVLAKESGELPSLPSGSRVEITGVCWTERLGGSTGFDSEKPVVASFQLLLRSPADVVLIERPPWWTWKHTASIVGGLLIVLAGALLWIRQLHQRVAERTQALRATMARLEEETKTSATLAERNRLAAEIHDGLEQGLNGIMMQLDGVETKLKRSPEAAMHHLDLARKMVRFSRTEVRHSLWDWKAPALADHDLKTALTEIVSQMAQGNIARVSVEVTGSSRPLPPAMEHHVLRICQEALTNALKHAHARNIAVTLDYTDGAVELSVRDDGHGFVPDTVLNGMVGHLGLQNLRSRARKLGGELTVTSAPEKGATISVRIPCPPGGAQAN